MPHSKPLKGQTILVTRPVQSAQDIAHKLKLAGAHVVVYPTIEIHRISPSADTLERLRHHKPYDLVIFISKNAAWHGAELLDQIHLTPEAHIAAIGTGTQSVLAEMGVKDVITGREPYDSEALLKTLDLQGLNPESVLIVKGAGGRKLLAQDLRSRKARVQELEVYRRELPVSAFCNIRLPDRIDFILFTSSESASNLLRLLTQTPAKNLFDTQIIAGHPSIAATVTRLGFKKPPIIATSPGDEAMLHALVQYVNTGAMND